MNNLNAKLKLLNFIRQYIQDFDLNNLDELLALIKEATNE